MAEFQLRAVNATIEGSGHPGWFTGLPSIVNGTLGVSGSDAVAMGRDPVNCLLVAMILETDGQNPDRPEHWFTCADNGNMVFGEDLFGEPLAFIFIEDRGTAIGSAYTMKVLPGGDSVERPLTGTMQAWTNPNLPGHATIEYITFDFEGTVTWTYHQDIPVGKLSELDE